MSRNDSNCLQATQQAGMGCEDFDRGLDTGNWGGLYVRPVVHEPRHVTLREATPGRRRPSPGTVSSHAAPRRPVLAARERPVVPVVTAAAPARAFSQTAVPEASGSREQVLALVLDTVGTGLLAVTGTGRIRHANRRGEEILAQGTLLAVHENHLLATQPERARDLAALIATAACARPGDPGAALRLGAGGNGPALNALVLPLACEQGLALIVLSDAAPASTRQSDLVARAYGLTECELRVARALLDGLPPKRIARAFDLSLNTVKSHLRSVFQKLGVRRQVDVARVLLTMPPIDTRAAGRVTVSEAPCR